MKSLKDKLNPKRQSTKDNLFSLIQNKVATQVKLVDLLGGIREYVVNPQRSKLKEGLG